jgi:hypothetical protein
MILARKRPSTVIHHIPTGSHFYHSETSNVTALVRLRGRADIRRCPAGVDQEGFDGFSAS